jgi:hypothetical protein
MNYSATIKRLAAIALIGCGSVFGGQAQEKGVDTQNSGIRDASGGNNSGKVDKGSGRGVNFGKGKTPAGVIIANPFRLNARRETALQAIRDTLQERGIVIDDDASKPNEGVIRTLPFVFAKGSVITISELQRYAESSNALGRSWTRARHTLTFEAQPIDGVSLNLSLTAKIEGRSDGPTGPEWISLRSNGDLERAIIAKIVEAITGSSPTDPAPQP